MSDSREESPDWLRSFEPPAQYATLSSGSESPLDLSPVSNDEDSINLSKLFKKEVPRVSDIKDADDDRELKDRGKSPKKNGKPKQLPERKRKNENESKNEGKEAKGKKRNTRSVKHEKFQEQTHSIWSLSSDSESCPDTEPVAMDGVTKMELSSDEDDLVTEHKTETDDLLNPNRESPRNCSSKSKSPVKKVEKGDVKTSIKKAISSGVNGENDNNDNSMKDDNSRKHSGPQVSTSRVALLLPEKVQRSKALVECEGDSIDLSGDVGSVGRIVISEDHSRNQEILLDLKGTIYKTTIVPSRTFCVVSFGQSEAKIEAIMNDYIQLKPLSNVYEAETMVEGTLDGFSFDSEDEAEKVIAQPEQNEIADEQPDAGKKRKPGKAAGAGRKKGKPAGGKPSKKVKKKPSVPKKSKSKK